MPTEVLDAIRDNGLAIVALVLVSTALVIVVRTFYRDLKDRIKRAEHLTDLANASNDKLADLFEAALNELRGR